MEWIIIFLLIVLIIVQLFLFKRFSEIKNRHTEEDFKQAFERIERNFREDFKLNREESRAISKENRDELATSMKNFQLSFERGIANFNALQREKFCRAGVVLAPIAENLERTD